MKRFQISESTKRVLGILNKICLTMLALIFIGLVEVWILQDKADTFNMGDIEKQITGDNLVTSDYKDTVQDAMLRGRVWLEAYQCNIDEEIFRMRNDDFMVVYYRAVGAGEESFIEANFRVLEDNEREKYALVSAETNVRTGLNQNVSIGAKECIYNNVIKSMLDFINYADKNHDNDDENNKIMVYGDICEDYFEDGESIYNLQIDGQYPDEIVEYECFGKNYYFWYYDNLETDKTISEEMITLTETAENRF